ncbi:hypothetical protein pb186bvf_005641 [Paramecium bursaria]
MIIWVFTVKHVVDLATVQQIVLWLLGFLIKAKQCLITNETLPSDRIKFDRNKFKRRQKNNAWLNYQENFECVLQLVLDNYEELSHLQMDGFRDYIHSQIQLQKGLSNSLIPKNTIKYLTFTQQYTSKWNDKQLEIPNIVIKGPRRQSLMSNVQIKEELKIEEEIPTQTNDPHSQVDNLSIQVQQDLPQKNTLQDIPIKLSINDIPQRASNKVIHLVGPTASTPVRSPIKRQTLKKLFDDEEEQEQQIMGQYLDIFYNFDKQKEFVNFFTKYNLSNILNELSFQQTFQPDTVKNIKLLLEIEIEKIKVPDGATQLIKNQKNQNIEIKLLKFNQSILIFSPITIFLIQLNVHYDSGPVHVIYQVPIFPHTSYHQLSFNLNKYIRHMKVPYPCFLSY